MKQKWSPEWKSSVQPRKQRKYVYNAPLHVKRKFLGAKLSKNLSSQFGRRSMPLRKGDEILVMRGSSKGLKGVIERVNVQDTKVYVEGITVKKVDGSEVMKAMQPSNLMITKPKIDDKGRQKIMDRTQRKALETQKDKPKPKEGKDSSRQSDKAVKSDLEDKPKETKKEEKKIDSGPKKGTVDGMKKHMNKGTKDGI